MLVIEQLSSFFCCLVSPLSFVLLCNDYSILFSISIMASMNPRVKLSR